MPIPQHGGFDEEVAAYDRARPSYPDALFDDLISYLGEGGMTAPFDAVEIGPGTGKATGALLGRGFRVTAIEYGPAMAAFLRAAHVDDERLRVVHARFEDAALADGAFDAVVSATSFHWLDHAVRLVKPHRLLRPQGVLAVIDTNQIAAEADRGFFDRTLPVYERARPGEPKLASPGADVEPRVLKEVTASSLFEDVRLFRYRWDQTYPTELYADLVRSYSNTQAMPRHQREAMIAELCALIDAEFDGYVVRPLVITLVVARRKE
jgi:SAM-dependent methyltransferase